ncbi:MAG: DUF3987 domain-containing protein [Bacteroidales bacterium]|nr:DUF3987 domain-containing protein [Bacteroidales bacterium]
MIKKNLKMGYMPNVSGADQRVHTIDSMEELEQLINAPELKNAVERIPDTPSVNTPEELEVLKKTAAFQNSKKNLPVMVWQASFEGKKRSNENAIPNGLFMTDFDGIFEDLDALYHSAIEPRIEELGIVVVHKTPSRKGLRVVAQKKYVDIVSNQHWMAEMLGLELDEACKDVARASFLVPRDYFFYLAPDLFEKDYLSTELIEEEHKESSVECNTAENGEKDGETNGETDPATYNGVHITDVLDRYISLKGGEFVVGERNSQELRLCCSLVHYYGVDVIKKYLPTYGLDDKEIDRIIQSAEEYYKKGSSHVAGDFQKILQELETEAVMDAVPFDEEEFWEKTKLPIGIKETLEHCANTNERIATLFLTLSYCGFYANDIEFYYLKRNPRSKSELTKLNFWVMAVAPTSNSKSVLLNSLYNSWIRVHDDEVAKGEYDDRTFGTSSTVQGLVAKLKKADKHHVFTNETEGQQIMGNCGIGGHFDYLKPLLKSFDNEMYQSDYVTQGATKGKVKVLWNINMAGTSAMLDDLFRLDKNGRTTKTKMTEGYLNRPIIVDLPPTKVCRDRAVWDFDLDDVIETEDTLNDAIDRAVKQMRKYGEDYKNKIGTYKELLKAIHEWIMYIEDTAEKTGNLAFENFKFRTAKQAARCGVIFHILENEGNDELQPISKNAVDFAVNCANYMMRKKMQLFGAEYNEVLKGDVLHKISNTDVLANEVVFKKTQNLWKKVEKMFKATFKSGATKEDLYKLYCNAKGREVNQTTFERAFRTALNGDSRNSKILYKVSKNENGELYSFEEPKIGMVFFMFSEM